MWTPLRAALTSLLGGRLPLDLEHRAVYHLKHVAGLTFDEVASVVGCSPRTAKTRMKRALEAIGAELERLGLEV